MAEAEEVEMQVKVAASGDLLRLFLRLLSGTFLAVVATTDCKKQSESVRYDQC